MLFKFLNNFTKKKQNTHEDFYCTAENLNRNVIKQISQPKKMKKIDGLIQETDANFFTIAESRNSKHGIMHYDSEND